MAVGFLATYRPIRTISGNTILIIHTARSSKSQPIISNTLTPMVSKIMRRTIASQNRTTGNTRCYPGLIVAIRKKVAPLTTIKAEHGISYEHSEQEGFEEIYNIHGFF